MSRDKRGWIAIALTALVGLLLSLAVTPAKAGGVISVKCKLSHLAQVDPIVSPGTASAHLHAFTGSRTTNENSTYESMIASGTSCPAEQDTAGYWVPVIVNPNGELAKLVQINAYYRTPSGVQVSAFDADLRIIAGGDTKNPPQPSLVQNSLSYSCRDSGPFFDHPIDCGTRATIAHIHFPNCVEAGVTDSVDHRSHMVYANGKSCPSGYVQVPKLSLHARFKGVKDGATLSSDTAGSSAGQTLHADFWNTWDQPTLECLVDKVLNKGLSRKGLTTTKIADIGC